MLLIIGF